MTKEEALDYLKKFADATPYWYESLSDELKRAPQCLMCGIVPDHMKKLAEAIETLNI